MSQSKMKLTETGPELIVEDSTGSASLKDSTEETGDQIQLNLPFIDWMDVQLKLKDTAGLVHISGPLLTVIDSLIRYVWPYVFAGELDETFYSRLRRLVKVKQARRKKS